jgi:hypothetical protein
MLLKWNIGTIQISIPAEEPDQYSFAMLFKKEMALVGPCRGALCSPGRIIQATQIRHRSQVTCIGSVQSRLETGLFNAVNEECMFYILLYPL